MSSTETFIAIIGLALITLATRAFFLFSERELVLPDWINRGLRYAPLAALTAVLTPEIVMSQGQLIDTWQDARLFAVAAASAYFFWRRGILGTIVTGMAVLLPLKLLLGW
ncbi:AzlD domain-containing protein [Piscinibacter sakaiensis]|uniref:AzlD domain-containing protein n=1 Tax=Piscinibacter sakaiensis TaxID=1547922 RepID=UPI003AABAE94